MFKKIKAQDQQKAQMIANHLSKSRVLSSEEQEFLNNYGFDIQSNTQMLQDNLYFALQPYYYLGANPTADCVIIYKNQALLIQRSEGAVEGGKWAIPGGFVDTLATYAQVWKPGRETPQAAALREFLEEAGLDLQAILTQAKNVLEPISLGVFEGNQRDPRDNTLGWSQSHAYLFIIPDTVELPAAQAGDDAQNTQWFDIDKMPTDLAFDHNKILSIALAHYNQTQTLKNKFKIK